MSCARNIETLREVLRAALRGELDTIEPEGFHRSTLRLALQGHREMPTNQTNFPFAAKRLLGQQLLLQYLDEKRTAEIPDEATKVQSIRDWVSSLRQKNTSKETSLEQAFNHKIMCGVFGYVLHPSAQALATAWVKPPSAVTQIPQEPDVALGSFPPKAAPRITGILELKKPRTNFDAPQAREGRKTPVEQAFDYGERILGTRWVIVSDMLRFRLYSIESQSEFEEFDLSLCAAETEQAAREFRRLFFLLHHDYLVKDGAESTTSRLLAKSHARQLRIFEEFYGVYYRIRKDLLAAVESAAKTASIAASRDEVFGGVQRLLDRLLFLFYCEHHPDALVKKGTVAALVDAGRRLPGSSDHKVYDLLKLMFQEVDKGSPRASGLGLSAYNGELFKDHPIIDHIDLPDTLNDNQYSATGKEDSDRTVQGVWGLHAFDFWQELNEHLLGHVFEESLPDAIELGSDSPVALAEKLAVRRKHGIFYTDQILADFVTSSAIRAFTDEIATPAPVREEDQPSEEEDTRAAQEILAKQIARLTSIRVVDFACGSGAFLVSAYRELLTEYRRVRQASQLLSSSAQWELSTYGAAVTQAKLLRECLFGVDLHPQAVEIAKLALWLRSARKGEKVADLGGNLVHGDSLEITDTFKALHSKRASFDLVVGNPPWGGEISPDTYSAVCQTLGLPAVSGWDSWELFLVLAVYALRPNGRLAIVLPDTIFSPEKAKIRRFLLDNLTIEKLHSLGPDWFGKNVRMGTVVIQARKSTALLWDIKSLLLTGTYRKAAIARELPLKQLESRFSRNIPQERCLSSPGFEIEIFRSRADDAVMSTMVTNSIDLAALCNRYRGEEMSKEGHLWVCPGCLRSTTPGKKEKGGGYKTKQCPNCRLKLSPSTVSSSYVVQVDPFGAGVEAAAFIDGDDISRRYIKVTPSKHLRLDVEDHSYKPLEIYSPSKLLIRQAGVGIWATIDDTGAHCPQSVYIYRLTDVHAAAGYRHEFLLGALSSRTMAYYIFKRFGEIDPDRAHVKLTHDRLARLPIPSVDFSDSAAKKKHDVIVSRVADLLNGRASLGGRQDLEVELALRQLWGLTPEEGSYVNGEFALVPDSQAIRDLFPDGVPGAP